jgi:hypothetical protein
VNAPGFAIGFDRSWPLPVNAGVVRIGRGTVTESPILASFVGVVFDRVTLARGSRVGGVRLRHLGDGVLALGGTVGAVDRIPGSVGTQDRSNVIRRQLERVLGSRLDRSLEGDHRIVRPCEQRDGLPFGVVAATREFAHDPGRPLEWHTADDRSPVAKG